MTGLAYKIFVIAGEASGDQIAARFIADLKEKNPEQDYQIVGIGGDELSKVGLKQSLFPMETLSVMGIFEVLPKILELLGKIDITAKAINDFEPDLVLSVDAPDFCFRVIKRYQKKFYPKAHEKAPRFEHIVAPTVWAWRPKRAEKVAKLLDHLYCLFPFEPPYFEKEGLSASYLEHPFLPLYEQQYLTQKSKQWRKDNGYSEEDKLFGIFPGSRKGEVKRMLPVFIDAMKKLQQTHPEIKFTCLTLPKLKGELDDIFKRSNLDVKLIDDIDQKPNMMGALNYAIATSGTIGFELSLAKVPHIVAYKMNWLSRMMAKLLVKTPYMHLTNIHLNREVVPEFFQENCTSKKLSGACDDLIKGQNLRDNQRSAFDNLWSLLNIS